MRTATSCFLALWFTAALPAQDPPPCAGGEDYQLKVQVSPDGGATWYSDSLWIEDYPGYSIELPVRTVLVVNSGDTQGWSFGVQYDPSSLHYYGGDLYATDVTTSGTHTETVQGGWLPPDFDASDVQSAHSGISQGIVIDNNSYHKLASPTGTFVTAGVCFTLQMPVYEVYGLSVPLTFTHEIGDPSIDTVVSQNGVSTVPCVKNFTLYVTSNWGAPSGTATYCPPDWTTGSETGGGGGSGPYGARVMLGPGLEPMGPMGGGPAGGQMEVPGHDFVRGDADDSGGNAPVNITDGLFTLNFLFTGGSEPTCMDCSRFERRWDNQYQRPHQHFQRSVPWHGRNSLPQSVP